MKGDTGAVGKNRKGNESPVSMALSHNNEPNGRGSAHECMAEMKVCDWKKGTGGKNCEL